MLEEENSPLSTFEKIKIERGRLVFVGRPVIEPSKYGVHGPIYDIFALFHNASKKQIIEAYNMIEDLLRYKYEVTPAEKSLFFDWLDTFESAISKLFVVEESVLYPFLHEINIELPDNLSGTERERMKYLIKEKLNGFNDNSEKIRWLPVGESLPRIAEIMNEFLASILHYLKTEQESLSEILSKHRLNPTKIRVLRSRVIESLRNLDDYSFLIVFITNWLPKSELRCWKRSFLGTIDAMRYDQWARKYVEGHGKIPQELQNRLHTSSNKEGTNRPSGNFAGYFLKK